MKRIAELARLLPALTAENAVEERARLVDEVRSGGVPSPRWMFTRRRVDPELWRLLEGAAELARGTAAESLYAERAQELELELAMIDALGDPKRVRPLAARRFGDGRIAVVLPTGPVPLARLAEVLLESLPHREEPREIPPWDVPGRPSLAALMSAVAQNAGIQVDIKIEPRLSAGAATGDRTIFIADRRFGRRESLRFAVHEVLGHAVAAANARSQPIRIFEIGTAGSFSAQEGLALWLEEKAGVLDAYRLRTIAARVLATDRMHRGSAFGETARWLHRELSFSAIDAVSIAERAYRGGGVARDAGYLAGWLEVRAALGSGTVTIDALRMGRVGIDVARRLPELASLGLARPPRYRPSLASSLRATEGGTSLETSPPSIAASLTMFEET
jgi:uncharacterized protein (TIGR02421 family)